ncbi:MAG: hypothetical protein MRJ92_09925 [Nitrospira sp.]|nr:hypothetical protein [Nitrospira sp.]
MLMLVRPASAAADLGVGQAEVEETARLLAALLESGQAVIERNQTLIDDPHQGEKGLTPELFEAELVREFRAKSRHRSHRLADGSGVPRHSPACQGTAAALVQAGREVVRDARVVINRRDRIQEFHSGDVGKSGFGPIFQIIARSTQADRTRRAESEKRTGRIRGVPC